MGVSKEIEPEEMERVSREEYDEDGYAKEGADSLDTKIQELRKMFEE